MRPTVYIHTRLDKELEQLKTQENTPGFAARKAEQIISALAGGEIPPCAGKLSRKGDARIRNCLKYDLGKGYRLVCVKEKKKIYALFAGCHDSCHTWMDKHRRLKIDSVIEQMVPFQGASAPPRSDKGFHRPEPVTSRPQASFQDSDGQEAPDPLETISQKDLRAVFQGLVNALS